MLSYRKENLDELLADIPRYYSTPEIRVTSSDEKKFQQVEKVKEHFRGKYEIIEIDGARIIFLTVGISQGLEYRSGTDSAL
jgi:phosphomannomutase